jgi:hypothetical protein
MAEDTWETFFFGEPEHVGDTQGGLQLHNKVPDTRDEALAFILLHRWNAMPVTLQWFLEKGLITIDDLNFHAEQQILGFEQCSGFIGNDTIWEIAREHPGLYEQNFSYIFEGYFYRHDGPLPFSAEKMCLWYEAARNGRLKSIIGLAIENSYPGKLGLQSVRTDLEQLSRYEPKSHGVHRYIHLALQIAGEDASSQLLVLETITSVACNVRKDNMMFRMCLDFIRDYETIPEHMRKIALGMLGVKLIKLREELDRDIALVAI